MSPFAGIGLLLGCHSLRSPSCRYPISLGARFGSRSHWLSLGKATRRVVWRYLADRVDGNDHTAPLFLARADRPMRKDALRQLIVSLGKIILR